MNSGTFTQCKQWFGEHVSRYREKSAPDTHMVDRKQRHTMRVLAHVQAIVDQTPPLIELKEIIEIAALLHDAGRFPQVVGHKSYDDHATYNHAEVGANIIRDTGLLDPLPIDKRGLVLSAIKYHNRGVIPNNLGTEARLVLEVLRDADKLDALRNCLRYLDPSQPYGKALKSGMIWDDTEATPHIIHLAMNRKLIPFQDIKWSNDFIIFLSCWLYDLHFPYAFRQLKESGEYANLLSLLPGTPEMTPLVEQLREDFDWILARSGK